jgi:hypothetical protein
MEGNFIEKSHQAVTFFFLQLKARLNFLKTLVGATAPDRENI